MTFKIQTAEELQKKILALPKHWSALACPDWDCRRRDIEAIKKQCHFCEVDVSMMASNAARAEQEKMVITCYLCFVAVTMSRSAQGEPLVLEGFLRDGMSDMERTAKKQ